MDIDITRQARENGRVGDPMEEEGGVNLYGFVGNDSVNAFDPSGLLTASFWREDSMPTGFSYIYELKGKPGEIVIQTVDVEITYAMTNSKMAKVNISYAEAFVLSLGAKKGNVAGVAYDGHAMKFDYWIANYLKASLTAENGCSAKATMQFTIYEGGSLSGKLTQRSLSPQVVVGFDYLKSFNDANTPTEKVVDFEGKDFER